MLALTVDRQRLGALGAYKSEVMAILNRTQQNLNALGAEIEFRLSVPGMMELRNDRNELWNRFSQFYRTVSAQWMAYDEDLAQANRFQAEYEVLQDRFNVIRDRETGAGDEGGATTPPSGQGGPSIPNLNPTSPEGRSNLMYGVLAVAVVFGGVYFYQQSKKQA